MPNKFNLKDLQSAYFGLLTEAKIDDMLEKSDLSPNQKIKVRGINDKLTNKTRYVNFLINNIEDIDDIDYKDEANGIHYIDDLLYIEKFSQAFPGLDMDKATIQKIHELVEDHQHKKEMEKVHPEAEKIFEDKDVLIVSPLTYEAAVYHGKGTNWCISTSNPDYWDSYTSNQEKFYFFISKKYPITHRFSKVAVQIKQNGEIDEFRDKKDETIEGSDIKIYDFHGYMEYLKPKKMTLEDILKYKGLIYNESTGLYDCNKDIAIENDSPLLNDGKLIIKLGHIKGYFDCSNCRSLISLEGFPEKTDGGFDCHGCTSLTSLKGCPKEVGGYFSCTDCSKLTSLEGCSEKIDGTLYCYGCSSLTSLKGCPKEVGGSLHCHGCSSLISLEGAPEKVNRSFSCSFCSSLTSLEGAPKEVGKDFDCRYCGEKFTKDDVLKISKVSGNISV